MMNNKYSSVWSKSEVEYPAKGSFVEKAKFFLSYAILAPSSHNTQPWLFKIGDNFIDIIPDYSRSVAYSDRMNRELFKSIGCCVGNLIVALQYFGNKTKIEYFPEDSVDGSVVRIMISPAENQPYGYLFEMLTKRVTNRGPYKKKDIQLKDVNSIKKIASNWNCNLGYIDNPLIIGKVAEIVRGAAEFAFGDNIFKSELAEWVRPNNTSLSDGMPLLGFGVPDDISQNASKFIRNMTPKQQGEIDYLSFVQAPALIVISTDRNDQESWIKGGIAYELISLFLFYDNISTAPNAGIIEHEDSLLDLKKVLNLTKYPLFLARVGYIMKNVPHTPRRSVVECLIT